jgi:hypothetical protein
MQTIWFLCHGGWRSYWLFNKATVIDMRAFIVHYGEQYQLFEKFIDFVICSLIKVYEDEYHSVLTCSAYENIMKNVPIYTYYESHQVAATLWRFTRTRCGTTTMSSSVTIQATLLLFTHHAFRKLLIFFFYLLYKLK